MQIFKTFEEKKVKLIGVDELCVYTGKFNLLTNNMTVKLYYKGSLVAKRKRKIQNEYDYKLVEFFEDNEAAVADFKSGKRNADKAFTGFLMKATKGKANPQVALKLLAQELAKLKED